ncbi:hypothetical protein J2X06_001995 [Lysobacter niastensis]|uniref:DUF998 domain-containing protein n=1 Tax=Lysobacter niastensis TaxID=380629 RepID=A0ABU1WAZ0_9GAMM|nr:hypothetical protein [Lysobacter niastensis]MDR7134786.1 hypothetical protein [Lysobacter niastensis]
MAERASASLPLWPLPLLAAVLPLLVAHLAWWLSVRDGLAPACNPYLDGCVSISRAARHGLGNDLFRMAMLPCAVLQALCWVAATAWLRRDTPVAVPTLPWLGVVAGVALALYATFLGTEGQTYELLRRYGNVIYFGSTGLALLVALRALSWNRHAPGYRALFVIAVALLAIGLSSVVVAYVVEEPDRRDGWRNALEWHLGLWLTGIYAVLGWLWRRERWALASN